ncbi:kynureninase [Streptomyces sp. NBS 14/10]|uniref:kynureninase n=1 Tax=Streptomyces sp. NBS 14/10 TaxID=1945643 RepID=UPI000B7FD3AE|nr:kynureninase [Streptomyces sp. NBS 14/10]KAK1184902.1 kynureninase [Streptomyces sp. NBS 14/10]
MSMETKVARDTAADLDAADPLRAFRHEFVCPEPETIYLDGNSLGRLPTATAGFLGQVVRDGWGAGLVRSWETWISWSRQLGDRLAAHTLGARPGEVVISDSTSVNLYKLATAALDARPGRRTIVADIDDFPTNRYILQGLAEQRGLRLVTLRSDPDQGLDLDVLRRALSDDVALVVLSLVSYRSGALLDMAAVNGAAERAGALVLWDLSHAAGVVPVRLGAAQADLAVGSTYKYLNGGPGSPAFLYVRKDLQRQLRQPIWGWFGQRDQFRMGEVYDPVGDIDRFLVGTPPLLSLAAIQPALEVIERVPISRLREKSVQLGAFAIELAGEWLTPHGFRLASPRDPARRGSHIALAHPEASRISRGLRSEKKVICDFRPPDRLRIGFAPLYTRFVDVWDGLDRLRALVESRGYEQLPVDMSRVT